MEISSFVCQKARLLHLQFVFDSWEHQHVELLTVVKVSMIPHKFIVGGNKKYISYCSSTQLGSMRHGNIFKYLRRGQLHMSRLFCVVRMRLSSRGMMQLIHSDMRYKMWPGQALQDLKQFIFGDMKFQLKHKC